MRNRGVYEDLREHGSGRLTSYLFATGLWVRRPFIWFFPEVKDDSSILPPPRRR